MAETNALVFSCKEMNYQLFDDSMVNGIQGQI